MEVAVVGWLFIVTFLGAHMRLSVDEPVDLTSLSVEAFSQAEVRPRWIDRAQYTNQVTT